MVLVFRFPYGDHEPVAARSRAGWTCARAVPQYRAGPCAVPFLPGEESVEAGEVRLLPPGWWDGETTDRVCPGPRFGGPQTTTSGMCSQSLTGASPPIRSLRDSQEAPRGLRARLNRPDMHARRDGGRIEFYVVLACRELAPTGSPAEAW